MESYRYVDKPKTYGAFMCCWHRKEPPFFILSQSLECKNALADIISMDCFYEYICSIIKIDIGSMHGLEETGRETEMPEEKKGGAV